MSLMLRSRMTATKVTKTTEKNQKSMVADDDFPLLIISPSIVMISLVKKTVSGGENDPRTI